MLYPSEWTISCEGERLNVWRGERPETCAIQVTVKNGDRDKVRQAALDHGWSIESPARELCPACRWKQRIQMNDIGVQHPPPPPPPRCP